MKSSFKKLPGSQVELEVVLDQKEFLEYYQPVFDEAVGSVHLKGFRPGTAPKEMAEQAVDKEKVFEKAVHNAVRDNLQEISQENHWQVIDQPKIEILEDAKNLGGLKFKALLTLFPEVKLGDYRKISRNILQTQKTVTATDKEIEETINWVLNSRAKTARVSRPAQNNDSVEISYSGKVEGQVLDRLQNKEDKFILGKGRLVLGFEESILNHKEGDEWELKIQFPKDYWDKDLQDKNVDFQVKLKAVFERELPELTDEFIKGLGSFNTVEDFKKNVRSGLEQEKNEKEKERVRLKILEELSKNSTVDAPAVMIDRTKENMAQEYQEMTGKAPESEETKKQLDENARTSVKNNLILFQISKDAGLEPTEEEVKAEADKFLAHSQFSKQPKIDPQRLYDYIYGIVQNKKVFQYLENLK